MNSKNEKIGNTDLRASNSDKSLSVTLDSSKVIPGVYTINWPVISKDDSHIIKGSYVFSIEDNSSKIQQSPEQNKSNMSPNYSKNLPTTAI